MKQSLGKTLLAALAVIAVGCSSSQATPTAAPVTGAPVTQASATTAAASQAAAWQGKDDGTKLTMWTRAATEARARPIVQAYNASHKNQIDLTVVPTDDYQAKVGAAAGAGGLPDLFSADVVFMPNWTSAGLFTDITSRINSLPFLDKIAPAHIKVSTWQGKEYGLPFVIDLSIWMYNKKLFKQAGLDPDKPPTTLGEFEADARAVAKLGGNIHGTFFGGNCGGCEVFTWWPIAWADGQQVMNADGTQSLLNSDENKAIYKVFRDMVNDGTVLMPDSKTETGPTWTGYFLKGNIGIMPWPATLVGVENPSLSLSDVGITPIAGVNGGQSTFVGGDAVGISRDSKVVDQAWNFLAWLEGDDAQINVIAKQGSVVARSDLANNQYTATDPRLVLFNQIAAKGQTPFALKFGQTFNDPNGPWLVLLREAVFGDPSKIDADNNALNASLQP
ncbi:MAG: sugar ABC transporter substrate-binding protein [Candidatus Limnocylindrales bacterium]|jgi:multiple sugar transport system substrate-binding protein